MTPPPLVLYVRLLPGVVGESRRVVHVVPLDEAHVTETALTAYCGQVLQKGTTEPPIDGPMGMPCERCGQRAITATAAL